MNKIRKGDRIIVRTGKDKGKQGTVLAVLGDHVTVEGVNVAKKHVRPNPMLGTTGGVVDKVMPIHISNVADTRQHIGDRIAHAHSVSPVACA